MLELRLISLRPEPNMVPRRTSVKRLRRLLLVACPVVLACAGFFLVMTVEPYVAPTGSMAPTMLGDHFQVTCTTCKYTFSVAKTEGEMSPAGENISARCPLCGTGSPANDFTLHAADVQRGDRVFVNKLAYRSARPERWDVVVLKFPRDETKKFMKRLVALPGETLRVTARGDVSIRAPGTTTFEIARKPR